MRMSDRSGVSFVRLFLCPCIAVLLGCAAGPGRQQAPIPRELPAVKKDCTLCHNDPAPKDRASLKKKLSALCLDCHRSRVAPTEHKVDIVPSMQVKKLPLDNGKMTCVTCHDPHRNRYGALLRMRETDLCLACHPY